MPTARSVRIPGLHAHLIQYPCHNIYEFRTKTDKRQQSRATQATIHCEKTSRGWAVVAADQERVAWCHLLQPPSNESVHHSGKDYRYGTGKVHRLKGTCTHIKAQLLVTLHDDAYHAIP